VGYHVEHHDFMNVAWVRLPRIRKVAPDRYQALASYSSWTGLLRRFLVDRRLSACSRLVRET
jgi:sphingolipid delta-4 desaturase